MIYDYKGNPLLNEGELKSQELLTRGIGSLNEVGWSYCYGSQDGTLLPDGLKCICTPQFLWCEAGTVISVADGYRIAVNEYSSAAVGSHVSRQGLSTDSYTAQESCFIRVTVAKASGGGDITDIPDAVGRVSFDGSISALRPELYAPAAVDEAHSAAMDAFIRQMNVRAQEIGMTNSVFADVAGADTATNRVTTRDLCKLGVAASAYRELCRIWNKDSHTIRTLDASRREIVCSYGDDCTALNSAYPILGRKNGYMPLSGGGSSYTMVAICLVGDTPVVGAIGGATSRPNRPVAMKELMDNVAAIMAGQSASAPTYYTTGCAALVPTGNAAMYDGRPLHYLYELNADTKIVPASVTKVMTAIVALDSITDIRGTTVVQNGDIMGSNEQNLIGGEKFSYEQLLYLAMLPSNGAACCVMARSIGQMMTIRSDDIG